jgi:hypothetical protein
VFRAVTVHVEFSIKSARDCAEGARPPAAPQQAVSLLLLRRFVQPTRRAARYPRHVES